MHFKYNLNINTLLLFLFLLISILEKGHPPPPPFNAPWRNRNVQFTCYFRYLSTGDSHHTIAFSFRVGRTTDSSIVKEVCAELWNVLQPLYLATPTEEAWKQSEIGFRERWNFPNCIGSIDGKHVRIKCLPKNGSNFFCYKNFF